MLYDDRPRLMPLFKALAEVETVTQGWPLKDEKLPCVAITEKENAPRAMYDDAAYGAEIIYDVRVFALKGEQLQAIAVRVDDLMCFEGYVRLLCYEDVYDGVRVKLLRYTRLM
jgi:hypothetical protein